MYPTWLKKLTLATAALALAVVAGCGDGVSGAADSGVTVCDDLIAEYLPGGLSEDPVVSALQITRFELGLPRDLAATESFAGTEMWTTEDEEQWLNGLSNTEDAVAIAVGVPLQEYTDRHLESHVLTRYVRDGDTTLIVVKASPNTTQSLDFSSLATILRAARRRRHEPSDSFRRANSSRRTDMLTPATDIAVDQHYDLVIIGTGSGNTIPGPEFDGWSIAIVEKGVFGGTCLNVGCIPTKMFVYAADVALEVSRSERLGLDAQVHGVDWPSIVARVFDQRIDPIAAGGEEYRRGPETPNIDVYDQHAVFVGDRTLRTGQGDDQKIISGDQIVIAAGSRPFIPESVAVSGVRYYTNEDIMRLPKLPESMVIVGGGYIAMEFAHVFDSLGTELTIVSRSPLLRRLDAEVGEHFNRLAEQRFNVLSGRTVIGADDSDSGVSVRLDDGSVIESEILLVAAGRIPNGDQLDLASGGIDMTAQGRVMVDNYGRSTSAEGVWALGDISSPHMLKHVANAEARAIKHNLLHPDDLQAMPHDHVPAAVFTEPQIASVGLTEELARARGHNVTTKVQRYGDVAYGWAMEDSTGICKLVADRDTGRLLGAHYLGPQASTLIQQMITVLAFDLDLREVATKQYWIHPALPEVTENALLGLDLW